jgi:hypothetical protein
MLPMPNNGEEGAYTSNAVLGALLTLLVQKKVIDHTDVAILMRQAIQVLSEENNAASKRAAAFLSKGS